MASPELDATIWSAYARGRRQTDLARDFSLSQQAISQAIARHRATIPVETREDVIKAEVDFIRNLRDEVLELWTDMIGAPVTAGKDAEVVIDPATGQIVRDHTGRLNAVRTAHVLTERLHRVVGLDAVQRFDVAMSEQAAAQGAAAQAAAYLQEEATNDH